MNPFDVTHPICQHPRWHELTSDQQRVLLSLIVARGWKWSEEKIGEVIDGIYYFKPCPPANDPPEPPEQNESASKQQAQLHKEQYEAYLKLPYD